MEKCRLLAGLDPITLGIVKELTEIATQVGGIVLSHRKDQIEKDKEDFYKRVKNYHRRVNEMLEEKDKSPKRLAEDIMKDDLFIFLARKDITEKICKALMYAESLAKAKRKARFAVLRGVLRILENISRTSFS